MIETKFMCSCVNRGRSSVRAKVYAIPTQNCPSWYTVRANDALIRVAVSSSM